MPAVHILFADDKALVGCISVQNFPLISDAVAFRVSTVVATKAKVDRRRNIPLFHIRSFPPS